LDTALRQRLGQNARRFTQENFSLEKVRQRYSDLYTMLLWKKNRRPPIA